MKRIFCVTDYGAVAGDGTLQTRYIQAAIDACFLYGGGEVTVPAGEYLTATLRIRSHVTLHLLENAVLKGVRDPEAYTHFGEDMLEPPEDIREIGFSRGMLSRWCNAIIRGYCADDIRIIGERGSLIDGQNCYDAQGEEGFRGPHAIGLYRCQAVELAGYTVVDSGNWAHCIVNCRNLYVHGLTVLAGHDGIHCRLCDNVLIEDCHFSTGDDCVAGFNNRGMAVLRCELNSSCSAFRLGGTDVLIDRCRVVGPGRYGHRWKMSDEEKIAGAPTNETHRHNTLTGFLYFCCGDFELRAAPGNIVVQNTDFENVDCLFNLEFKQHIWCCNRSLGDITFRNCRALGLCEPMRAFSDANEPLTLRMVDCEVSLREGVKPCAMLVGHDMKVIELQNVTASGYSGDAVLCIRTNELPSDAPIVTLRDCEGIAVVRE